MSFTFVHTADWQIGKPFRNFDPRVSGVLEEARLDAIDRIGEAARAAGAAHVVVAGDIYDSETLPTRTLHQPLARMERWGGVRWHLLPGNHDPARAGGIWQRLLASGLPSNVTACLEPEPSQLAPGVVLLPAPLRSKSQSADPTAYMDKAVTPGGVVRIGLAHGSVQDFGEEGESAVRIAPDRAKLAGLAYLALGDWHGMTRINDRTWYSGTPEPDRFPDNAPGHALIVHIARPDAAPRVDAVATGRFVWAKLEAEVRAPEDIEHLERKIEGLAAEPSRLLLRMKLGGALSLADQSTLSSWCDRLEARLKYLDADLMSVRVHAEAADLDSFGPGGELRWAAERLQRMAEDTAEPRRAAAEVALARLFALVRQARESTP